MIAKVGDRIRIISLALDSDGSPDPSASKYIDREGTVEYIDSKGILHGTWGGLGILPEDKYEVIEWTDKNSQNE